AMSPATFGRETDNAGRARREYDRPGAETACPAGGAGPAPDRGSLQPGSPGDPRRVARSLRLAGGDTPARGPGRLPDGGARWALDHRGGDRQGQHGGGASSGTGHLLRSVAGPGATRAAGAVDRHSDRPLRRGTAGRPLAAGGFAGPLAAARGNAAAGP